MKDRKKEKKEFKTKNFQKIYLELFKKKKISTKSLKQPLLLYT
jgi:hypothetical protein